MFTVKDVSPHWSVKQSEAAQLPSAKGRSKSADVGGSPPVAPQKKGSHISASVSAGQSLSSSSSSVVHDGNVASLGSLSQDDRRNRQRRSEGRMSFFIISMWWDGDSAF